MIISFLIIALISFIYLFQGKKTSKINKEKEASRLIAQYQGNKEQSPRLYQELKNLLAEENKYNTKNLPFVFYLAILTIFFSCFLFWRFAYGEDSTQWLRLNRSLDTVIEKHQAFGSSYMQQSEFVPQIIQQISKANFQIEGEKNPNPLLIYCQALQRRIQRQDPVALEALAQCYNQLALYELSQPIYESLLRLDPNNPEYILAWVQNQAFAYPNKALPQNAIEKLETIIRDDQENHLAALFLASAYQQQKQYEKALIHWQQLLNNIASTDPLYNAILENIEKLKRRDINKPYEITIEISEDRIKTLPQSARLYLVARPNNERTPIAVKELPLLTTQNTTLDNHDTMAGAKLSDETQKINVQIILSPNGNAQDENNITSTPQPLQEQTKISLQ